MPTASVDLYRALVAANVPDDLAQRASESVAPSDAAEGLARVEAALARTDARVAQLDAKLDARIDGLEARMNLRFAAVEANLRWITALGGAILLAAVAAVARLWLA